MSDEQNKMDDLPKLELGEFEYWQDASPFWRKQKRNADTYFRLMGMEGLYPPLKKRRLFQRTTVDALISDMAKVIGLDDPITSQNLHSHWKRANIFGRNVTVVIFAITIPLLILAFYQMLRPTTGNENILFDLLPMFLIFFVYIVLVLGIRIAYAVLSKSYADSLAAQSAFFFMIEIMHEKALESYESRRSLQGKLVALRRYVLMISSQYKSTVPESDIWISSHFEKMGQYILEHEKLIVAPKADSLDILRRDFYKLVKILIGGQYGDFNAETQPINMPEKSRTSRVLGAVIGFIGLVVPTLILYVLYTNPGRIESMGVNTGTITLIAFAWFLLTVDASLKLGIVERITGLAKAIRDLG